MDSILQWAPPIVHSVDICATSTATPHSRKKFTTLRCPDFDAAWNGVQPRLSLADTTAPLSTKHDVEVPIGCSDVQRSLLFAVLAVNMSMFAPRSTSNFSMSRCPPNDAGCKGVWLSTSGAFTSEPRTSNNRVTSTCPGDDVV